MQTANEKLIGYLKENPNATKAIIGEALQLKGIQLHNFLRKQMTDGLIISTGEGQEATYILAETVNEEPATEEQPIVVDAPQSQVDTEENTGTEEQNQQTEQPGAIVNDELKEEEPVAEATKVKATTSRDNSKYKFNGVEGLGKGPLVRAVVAKYVEDHPDTTYKQLKEIFPDTLMKRFGVFANETEAKKLSGNKPRYFLKPEQMIKIKGQKEPIAICNQWTAVLIAPLILKAVKELGYKIK